MKGSIDSFVLSGLSCGNYLGTLLNAGVMDREAQRRYVSSETYL